MRDISAPQSPSKSGIRALRILVAEDNPVNQRLAIGLLKNMGHEVVLATNGEEAVARWSEGNPDLVLMDIEMPRVDGFEATRAIRERERKSGRRTPIIAVSATPGLRNRCLACEMDEYMSKPLNRPMLVGIIARRCEPQAAC